ncbi:MAG TPA: hypothetical protein VFE79_11545 [Paraburkholderia sp.]|jgi:hypothetical protein|nr:hypothetical protein [Paraburkholderia sp.]
MKHRVLMASASAVLFLIVPRTAGAQEGQQPAATSGRAVMQQNANESAQATSDMSYGTSGQTAPAGQAQNTSYGGVAAGRSDAGERPDRSCTRGPQCQIYFGQ